MKFSTSGAALTASLIVAFVSIAPAQTPSATIVTSAPVTLMPDPSRTPLATLAEGTQVRVVKGEHQGWYQISYKDERWGDRTGYVRAEHLKITQPVASAPSTAVAPVAPAPTLTAPPASSSNTSGATVAEPPAAAPRPKSRDGRIPVFVRGGGSSSGFTDPSKDRGDSVKDLQNNIRDSKVLTLAESPNDALVVLDVLHRETKKENNGWTAFSGTPQNKSYVTVKLRAGDFETELTGESGSKGMLKGYGNAAAKVVDQLERWARENRDRLLGLDR